MGDPVPTGRPSRFARSGLSAAPLAASNISGVVKADSRVAAAAPELGKEQAGSSTGQRISGSSRPLCSDDGQVVEADETELSSAPPFCSRTAIEARRLDRCSTEQPGVDRGFQGLVSNWGGPARGTADGAGFVQSLPVDGSFVQGAELEELPSGLPAVVSREGLPRRDSYGQWHALRIHRAGRAYATECLVDSTGDPGRIHSAGAPRTEWRPRTDASGAQGRDHTAALAALAGPATAHGPLGEDLQPNPATRSFEAASASGSLSAEADAVPECALELPEGMGCASSAEQRGDQMAREKAIRGGSIRGVSGWAEAEERREMRSLFCGTGDRGVVGIGPGRDAPSQVCPADLIFLDCFRPGDKQRPGSNPRAARCLPSMVLDKSIMCYQCVCPKCYQFVCPLPLLTLSHRMGEGDAERGQRGEAESGKAAKRKRGRATEGNEGREGGEAESGSGPRLFCAGSGRCRRSRATSTRICGGSPRLRFGLFPV